MGHRVHPNKMNAFGKCVSATNKAKAKAAKDDDEKAEDADGSNAAAACKKQQSENATKFAQDYKNFGQCVKPVTPRTAHKHDYIHPTTSPPPSPYRTHGNTSPYPSNLYNRPAPDPPLPTRPPPLLNYIKHSSP